MLKEMELMENYLELAAGIVERAVKDYIQFGWWLNNNPKPTTKGGKYFCKYNQATRELAEVRKFFNSKDGFVQDIFNGNDDAIGFVAEACEYVIKKGEYDTDRYGNLLYQAVKDKKTGLPLYNENGKVITEKVKIDKKVLYKYILPIVNYARVAIGLDEKSALEE